MEQLHPNSTTVERIMAYVQADQLQQAEALARLADYLEDCFSWEIEFDT